MGDIINLLPESIANQIAAGEVIQRPASVVKELMENSIDAGSDDITLVIKNSGKTLIQVIDNGKGMSDTDARMSFERHATSKINKTEDLFHIKTMGFRGEALASIASIAEVEMKTRPADKDIATSLTIKSSEVMEQTYCQAEPGTTISVKNLFFNVPARRKFLKSDSVELKHLLEEFKKVALAHPEVNFRVVHNENEIYNLPEGTLKKRLLGVFRRTYEDKLIRISEETEVVNISGYVGDPEISKRARGEQYLFVNKRYVKSPYLSHAIKSAYQNLLEDGQYPFHLLYLTIDPSKIDINVHPTKQEIKFDDERLIYNYLKVAIKHGLGRYSLSPQLDFSNDSSEIAGGGAGFSQRQAGSSSPSSPTASRLRSAPVMRNWQSLYDGLEAINLDEDDAELLQEEPLILPSAATGNLLGPQLETEEKNPIQIHQNYIMVQIKSGIIFIDQHQAHVRILYERYLDNLNQNHELVQKQLFPLTVTIPKDKIPIYEEIMPDLNRLGFEVQSFGGETFIIHGIPAGFTDNNVQQVMEKLIYQYAENLNLDLSKNENLARSMAYSAAIPRGKSLEIEEMNNLVDELFACQFPYTGPSGKKCFVTYDLKHLEKLFT